MRCPECGGDTKVVTVRLHPRGLYRRRECLSCRRRFTTIEARTKVTRDKETGFLVIGSPS